MCEPHAKPLRQIALLVKTASGEVDRTTRERTAQPELPIKSKKPSPSEQMQPCPICKKMLGGSGSVIGHLIAQHGAKQIVQPSKCPDCERIQPKPLPMLNHRNKSHGYYLIGEYVKQLTNSTGKKKNA